MEFELVQISSWQDVEMRESRAKMGRNVRNLITSRSHLFCTLDRCNKAPICHLGQIPAGARRGFLITLGHSDSESYFDSIAKPPGDTIIIDPKRRGSRRALNAINRHRCIIQAGT